MNSIIFKDRRDAGKKLARELAEYKLSESIIFAIPRGGVIVGAEIAQKLELDLDLIIPRKIGAPFNPEVAVGAVAQDGTVIFAKELLERLGLTKDDFQEQIKNEIKEINRRMELYRNNNSYPDYNLKNIILVDDGIATGYTVFAAIAYIKKDLTLIKLYWRYP
ncbi:phosphoribosyltransferase [Desulfolucanica intricata]|uniref:phosphoribosyltransferase n=1 Tax=Desulfolucanica intricata TaxID=1285191 RepID=UPI000AE83C8F